MKTECVKYNLYVVSRLGVFTDVILVQKWLFIF